LILSGQIYDHASRLHSFEIAATCSKDLTRGSVSDRNAGL
jgi:hypothetical protein